MLKVENQSQKFLNYPSFLNYASISFTGYVLWCLEEDSPMGALVGIGLGSALSTLFQNYYPKWAHQIRDRCGERFDRAVQWLHPVLPFLGGYLGGLPLHINILVGLYFFAFHFATAMLSWRDFDRKIEQRVDQLALSVEEAIDEGNLPLAIDLINRAEDEKERHIGEEDKNLYCKLSFANLKLIRAWLSSDPLDLNGVRKLAERESDPSCRAKAFSVINRHLLTFHD